jgi:hypothetical protein
MKVSSIRLFSSFDKTRVKGFSWALLGLAKKVLET